MSLPDDWQDNFAGAESLKCMTLYPSEDDLNLLRNRSTRDKESISAAARKAIDSYRQNESWRVSMFPQTALKEILRAAKCLLI